MVSAMAKSPKRPREDGAGKGTTKRAKVSDTGDKKFKERKGAAGKGAAGKGAAGKFKSRKEGDKDKGEQKTRKEQREVQKHRKSQRSHAELMEEIKKLWEVLRVKEMEASKRKSLVDKMEKTLRDNAVLIVHKHDGARIIECFIKYASKDQRSRIISELIKDILPLVKSKYGKFVVFKILKFADQAQKDAVMKGVRGHVLQLVKHKEGAKFIDTLFSDYCNVKARTVLIQEFYGNEFALFGAEGTAKSLAGIFKTIDDDEKKADIIKDMTAALTPVLNKETVVYSIVHRALLEFFLNAPAAAVTDMIVHIRDLIPEILHTKDGAHVSVMCIQQGTNKDRKQIVKALKSVADKVCTEEYGFLVMCAVFDCVDDTVLVGKGLLSAVASKIDDIVVDKYGWKVIMYLLQDRINKSVMNPTLQKILQHGDNNPYSKKDHTQRRNELRAYVREALSEACTTHMTDWVLDFFSCLLFGEILLHAGVPRLHLEQLAAYVGDNIELLENLETHRLLKRLVKEDLPTEGKSFAVLLSDQLGAMEQSTPAKQGAAFVLVALLESPFEHAKTKTATALKSLKALKTLQGLDEEKHNAGSRILLKHLSGQ